MSQQPWGGKWYTGCLPRLNADCAVAWHQDNSGEGLLPAAVGLLFSAVCFPLLVLAFWSHMTSRVSTVTRQPSHPALGPHILASTWPLSRVPPGLSLMALWSGMTWFSTSCWKGHSWIPPHMWATLTGILFELVSCFPGSILVCFPAGTSAFKLSSLRGD